MNSEIFEQPESYADDRPIVKMNGREYKIFKRSAGVSFAACPRSIADTLKALDEELTAE